MLTPHTRRKMTMQKQRGIRERRKACMVLIGTVALVGSTFTWVFSTSNIVQRSHLPLQQRKALLLRGGNNAADMFWSVSADAQPFNGQNELSDADHLIVVAGHSVAISGHLQDAGTDERDWYLLDYQRGKGLPQAILSHIRSGIKESQLDDRSLLIFSGGETRATTGPIDEGGSYFRVADAMALWDEPIIQGESELETTNSAASLRKKTKSTVRARTVTEEFATDSFQNLMFSICRFHEVTGSYPKKITVVSFTFKQKRFEELHAKALRWPQNAFRYIGIDPSSSSTNFDLEEAWRGEINNSVTPFETDPYGCHSAVLKKKRMERNPYSRTAPYELTCPEMKSLFNWCGPELISPSQVPWGNLE